MVAWTDVIPPPTEPLAPVRVRSWNRLAGFLFFVWGLSFACVATLLCATAVFLATPFVRGQAFYFRIAQLWASSILRAIGVQTEITFEAPLPKGPFMFASNHQSMIDILALFECLPRPFTFVAKKGIFQIPMLGWAMRAMQYIEVDRRKHADAVKSLNAAAARIHDGLTTTVFPEGTRSPRGDILPFKKGPFVLALTAQVPIVPVAVEGSLHVTPKHRWYICPNTVRILVGRPIPVEGLTQVNRDELLVAVRTQIIRMNRRLGGPGGDLSRPIAAAGFEGLGHAAR